MKINIKPPIYHFIAFMACIAVIGCASKKSGKKVSFMKNLTAHYNIYYNASEILKQSETNIRDAYRDDYNYQLDIFILPDEAASSAEAENLNEVINRANRIALEKYESNWVDDAFLLLAKAEYWKGNYFNAAEYFSYVSQNFPKEKNNTVEALVWHGKALFALNKNKEADSVLQLAYDKNLKHYRAELNAALANSYILQDKLDEAEYHLQKSINFSKNRYSKIRWSYILAQVQERNNHPEEAYKNYGTVVKSNASFEMSFNANLAQIRLREAASGIEFDRIATLQRLLKEDKNKEFKDQIYYQIAKTYEMQGDLDKATEYYITSAHTEPGSQKQKGLSYLRLAELNFDSLQNYAKAQLYYDSTLQFLPAEYPDYNTISVKAKNLQYLADRLTLIEKERELIMLGKLSEEERIAYIDKKIQAKQEEEQALQEQMNNLPYVSISENTQANKSGGSFYFDNPMAISQGTNEFKRKWGNRKLEDNWRISAGVSNAPLAQNTAGNAIDPNQVNNAVQTQGENIDSLRNRMLEEIPVTAEAQTASLNKIKTARYEIAMFYKEVLNDDQASINELEQLLEDYTLADPKVPELYYQLYRLYENVNPTRSNQYRDEIIRKFPESIYAKSLINPNFGKEEEAAINSLKEKYDGIYDSYRDKKYSEVIQQINSLESSLQKYPEEAPKFAYLRALAIGNMQKAPAFVSSLEEIVKLYPNDSLITPVAKSQLQYIAANKSTFYGRKTALLSYDANEYLPPAPVIATSVTKTPETAVLPAATEKPANQAKEEKKPENKPEQKQQTAATKETKEEPAVAPKKEEKKPDTEIKQPENIALKETKESTENVPAVEEIKPNTTAKAPVAEEVKPKEPEAPKGIAFSNNVRIRHAIVVDIKNSSINVAKPFAGVTKHFYSKFAPASVNLTIRTIGNTDKLIIVKGPFLNKDQAQTALNELVAVLPEILELQKSEYDSFVISEPNLLLINSTESLEQYKNYIK